MKFKVLGAVLVITFHISCALSSPLAETHVQYDRANSDQDDDFYRLPKSVIPEHYVIKLTPNVTSENISSPWPFDGEVEIRVKVEEDTDTITLHASDIDIEKLSVKINGTIINIVPNVSSDERHFLFIKKEDNSNFTTYDDVVIAITYTGYLRDDMRGFYRSYYYYNQTGQRWLATTQFEATHARRAFPCFDEPSFKATFDIAISVEEGFTAISNMPLKTPNPTPEAGRTLYVFETTQQMSTYLIAFMVSDFVHEPKQSKQTILRIWSRADALNDTLFSAQESPKILEALEGFLNISYTLTKMDEVAVPDFSAGAMENWGLVTYRERLLLSNDKLTDSLSKQRIFTTIAHEFAHQWFGNLVSPKWWSYTWLNEGFATYFEYFITHTLKPKWRLDEQFVVRGVQTALVADASASTHPMTHPVGSPDEIWGLFDTISYQKAGAVIRMFEHVLSPEVFRSGLEDYLNNRTFGVAEPEDLFTDLINRYNLTNFTNSYEVDLKELMHQWTTQPGYPVVTVNSMEDGTIQLQQERFLLKKAEMDSQWIIPISYACVDDKASFDNTEPRIFMTEQNQSISEFNTSTLCLINVKQSGYYRVNYDAEMWNKIIQLLNQKDFAELFPPLTRAQLIDDSFALAQAGIIGYEVPLSMSKYLENEKDFIPWYSALNSLSFLNTRFHGTLKYPVFSEYTLNLLENIYKEVGFKEITDDDHVKKLLQNLVLTWTCKLNHKYCVGNSTEMFRNMRETSAVQIPVDLQSVVYCTAAREGNESDWQFLLNRYINSNVATEKTLILSALGCVNNQEFIDELLGTAITRPEIIRMQDVASVFSAVYSSPGGVDLALEFVSKKYTEIDQYYKKFSEDVASLIIGIASRITNAEQFAKLKKLHADIGGDSEIFKAAEKTVQDNFDWMEKNQAKLLQMISTSGVGSISSALYSIILLSITYLYVNLQ